MSEMTKPTLGNAILDTIQAEIDKQRRHNATAVVLHIKDAEYALSLARRALEDQAKPAVPCPECLRKVPTWPALEQPAPTGEVTREHREAAEEWLDDNDVTDIDHDGLATLLATREQASFQKGFAAGRASRDE